MTWLVPSTRPWPGNGENIVISAGIPRSGSTMIFQILSRLFPNVIKVHNFCKNGRWAVCTYRDFRESAISLWRVRQLENSNLYKVIPDLKNGIIEASKYKDSGKCLMLRYEDFVTDVDIALNGIKTYFGIEINESIKSNIIKYCSLKNNMLRAAKFDDFSQFDPVSHIHGEHIKTPLPGQARTLVSDEQWEFLTSKLSDELTEFGYKL